MDMSGMNHSMHDHHAMGGMDTTTMAPGDHHHHHHHPNTSSTMMGGSGNMTGGTGDHSMHGMEGMGNGDHSMHGMEGMGDGDHSMHGMGGMDMMKMYFHTGLKEYILLEECHTDTKRDMAVACVVVFFMAILYEGLKFVRETLLQHSLQDRARSYYPDSKMSAAGNSQEAMVVRGPNMSVSKQMLSGSHLLQTILHVFQVFLSYCLMLVFMTYNVWLCISVVVGAGIGYFIFGWKRAVVVDSNEHCH